MAPATITFSPGAWRKKLPAGRCRHDGGTGGSPPIEGSPAVAVAPARPCRALRPPYREGVGAARLPRRCPCQRRDLIRKLPKCDFLLWARSEHSARTAEHTALSKLHRGQRPPDRDYRWHAKAGTLLPDLIAIGSGRRAAPGRDAVLSQSRVADTSCGPTEVPE